MSLALLDRELKKLASHLAEISDIRLANTAIADAITECLNINSVNVMPLFPGSNPVADSAGAMTILLGISC